MDGRTGGGARNVSTPREARHKHAFMQSSFVGQLVPRFYRVVHFDVDKLCLTFKQELCFSIRGSSSFTLDVNKMCSTTRWTTLYI